MNQAFFSCSRPIRLVAASLVLAFLAFAGTPATAQPERPEPPAIDADDRAAIIDGIAAALDQTYIFADVAAAMGERLRERLAAGDYDDLDRLHAFTDRLTEDLQAVSEDRHLRVGWDPNPPPAEPDPEDRARRQAEFEARMREGNFCFKKVERLEGNVGLLELDCFADARLGGPTAEAAMAFLAHVDALIIDLRRNGGGSPSMIQLLTSYLVEEPTHINSFYIREGDETRQFWTLPHVAGEPRPEVPLWVLTSSFTFSAAEEFSYNLRNLERATLVGETTGGGAHPVRGHWLEGYPVRVSLPYGRAVNPISGTNWEGTGVEPHVETPADEAFDVAYADALETVVERAEDPRAKERLAFLAENVKLRRLPVELSAETLRAYAGSYGPRVVRHGDGKLYYRRGDRPERALIPVGEDRFLLDDTNDFRIRFERDAAGRVMRLVGIYVDGREEPSERGGGE